MKPNQKSLIALLVSLALWGTAFPALKIALRTNSTATVMVVRYGFSFVLVLAYFLSRHRHEFRALKAMWPLALIGVYNFAGSYLQFAGIARTTATKSAVLTNIMIVAVPILAYWVLDERMDRNKWIAVVLSVVGALMLTTNLQFRGLLSRGTLVGDLLVTAATVFWALFIVFTRKYTRQYRGFWLLLVNQAVTFCLSVPLAPTAFVRADRFGLLAGLYLAVFCTVIPTALYNFSLKRVDATTSTILGPVETLVAALIGIVFFAETLRPFELVGTGLILATLIPLSLPRRGQVEEPALTDCAYTDSGDSPCPGNRSANP
ncbi:MAG TPA: EamA family transporter [Candidatus Aminicenantes bacterium]|nr:EamA family transporter [Candidatus Aminicenantes bacterium]